MKKILCTLLAAALLLALCACGGGSAKDAATYNDAGYYEIFSVDEGDETLTKSDFDDMEWTIFLQLNDDGTGVLDMDDGDITELTWKDGTINDGTGDLAYVLAGGMLTLDLSDSDGTFVMIFKKGAAPSAEEETAAGGSFADRFSRTGRSDPADTETADEPEPEETSEPDAKPAATGDFTPVSGTINGCPVEILAAEPFTDHDGKDAVRFYYEFTNSTDEIADAYWALNFAAEEDGYELVTTYASSADDVPEYGNDSLYIMPGATIRCIREYSFRPDGSELTFTISDYDSDPLVATFDPQALPGRPGDWTPELNPDLSYYTEYSDDGSSADAHVYIDRAERADGASWDGGGKIIRVFFDYTNLTDEEDYFASACMARAFQDGIEMDYGYAEDSLDSDDYSYDDVAAGETISLSRCWAIRSDSPIEIVVTDWWNDEVICACTFTFE